VTLPIASTDVRRNMNRSREICKELGGALPYDFYGFNGDREIGTQWHWLNFAQEDGNCWACRPGRWSEGVRGFPCSKSLPFACQRRRAYPIPIPRRPSIYNPTPTIDRPRVTCGSFCNQLKAAQRRKAILRRRLQRRRMILRRRNSIIFNEDHI